jgi:peroxiredoxin (alkyl hydroperoxide reductase subunit C)
MFAARLLARSAPSALRRAHHVSALPAVRKAAPAFSATAVIDGAFKPISLAQYAGKYVVLFWYPLDFTFVCPTEITAFSDRQKDFAAINAEVVGISIDSNFSHLAWIQTPRNRGGLGPMAIPLIGDISKEVSRAYGMVVEDAADDMNGVTLRGTVIVSPAGKVLHVSNTDAPVGRSVDEVLRLIQAFQYGACFPWPRPGRAAWQAPALHPQLSHHHPPPPSLCCSGKARRGLPGGVDARQEDGACGSLAQGA